LDKHHAPRRLAVVAPVAVSQRCCCKLHPRILPATAVSITANNPSLGWVLRITSKTSFIVFIFLFSKFYIFVFVIHADVYFTVYSNSASGTGTISMPATMTLMCGSSRHTKPLTSLSGHSALLSRCPSSLSC